MSKNIKTLKNLILKLEEYLNDLELYDSRFIDDIVQKASLIVEDEEYEI